MTKSQTAEWTEVTAGAPTTPLCSLAASLITRVKAIRPLSSPRIDEPGVPKLLSQGPAQ